MDKRVQGRRFGYLTAGAGRGHDQVLDHQQVSGYSVGIIYIEDVWYPMLPGSGQAGSTISRCA